MTQTIRKTYHVSKNLFPLVIPSTRANSNLRTESRLTAANDYLSQNTNVTTVRARSIRLYILIPLLIVFIYAAYQLLMNNRGSLWKEFVIAAALIICFRIVLYIVTVILCSIGVIKVYYPKKV